MKSAFRRINNLVGPPYGRPFKPDAAYNVPGFLSAPGFNSLEVFENLRPLGINLSYREDLPGF